MQGIIFNALGDFVEEIAGMEVWNEAIESSLLKSEGAFTSGQTYPDEDAVTLAIFVANKLNIELSEALQAFGRYLFTFMIERGPIEIKQYMNAQSLLQELDGVIHREVRRVQPEAYTPFFEYQPNDEREKKARPEAERLLDEKTREVQSSLITIQYQFDELKRARDSLFSQKKGHHWGCCRRVLPTKLTIQ